MTEDHIAVAKSPSDDALHEKSRLSPKTTKGASISEPHDQNSNIQHTKVPSWLKEAVQIAAGQWFLISLGILIAIASQVQVPSDHQELKRTVTSYLCISIIFFVLVYYLNVLNTKQTYLSSGLDVRSTLRSCCGTTHDGSSIYLSKSSASS